MKKVVFNKHGGIEVLEFTEACLSESAPDEASLKFITSSYWLGGGNGVVRSIFWGE